jgi:hypothetical protein
MRHRWSAWLGVAVSVTVLGLVIGSVQHAGTRDRDSAASWPSAGVINAWMAAAISSARAEYVLQMIVTTPQGVTRAIIDDPGQATELVHNYAGATVIEAAVREVSGPVRKYESRTVNFAAGTWSQSVLVTAPAGSEPSGGQHVESPAEAIAAQLRHPLGAGGHALRRPDRATWSRAVRAATIDGEPVYVPGSQRPWRSAGHGLDQPVQLASGPVGEPGDEHQLRVDGARHHSRGQFVALRPGRPDQDPAGVNDRVRRGNGGGHALARRSDHYRDGRRAPRVALVAVSQDGLGQAALCACSHGCLRRPHGPR